MQMFAEGAAAHGFDFIVIGDTKSPTDFSLEGCRFFNVNQQEMTGLAYAMHCPTRHYARKNIGYLIAIKEGADVVIDTDDDNLPRDGFWSARAPVASAPTVSDPRWINVYRYFSDALIWPRGLPLDEVNRALPDYNTLPEQANLCPIQQGLADENPDIDAVYRLLLPLPQSFFSGRRLILRGDSWCPFNSQNTTWFRDAFPLLYLPAHCSFRMTDIWRSFVAQRIARENGWGILFHEATVWQERNEHNLMRDFADEVPGYLFNDRIKQALDSLVLNPGKEAIPENMRRCYRSLVNLGAIGGEEMPLLDYWLECLASAQN